MELDLKRVLRVARRRGWIVILTILIAATLGYVNSARQPELYSAQAQVLMLAMPDAGSRYTGLLASQSLKPSYMLIIKSEPVLQRVVDELELPYPASALAGKIIVSDVRETQYLDVQVIDTDPEMAARIATSVVEQFVAYIEGLGTEGLGVPAEVANSARVPGAPFQPQPMSAAQTTAVVGLLLGVAIVVLLEYFYSAVTPEQDIQELVDAPVLATVPQTSRLKPGPEQVYTMAQPRSSAAEALRLLRTNIEFASASADIDTLVVSSPGSGEGKSTIVANLGVVMAQGGIRSVIIDADLRSPTQHRIFGVPGDDGLTTLLTNPDDPWQDHAKQVALPGLYLIPSGPLPPNPFDLVSSQRFRELVDQIKDEVGLVLIDSPPILSASDSLAIAAHADGLMLVCQSHKTRIDALRHAAQSAHQGDLRLVGVVLNQLKGQKSATYHGEFYGAKEPAGQ